MGNEIETRTQVLDSIVVEAKRKVLGFLAGNDRIDKVSVFPPYGNIEKLAIGKEYEYIVEHVPMDSRDPGGKKYHNITKQKEGEYNIKEAPIEADLGSGKKTPSSPQRPEDARERYWRVREENELARQPVIVRESCLSTATNIVAALIDTHKLQGEQAKNLTLTFAEEFEVFATTGKRKASDTFGKEEKKQA